jgi:hypothetical protein
MNDDIREKLSAYLDGALSDADRRAVEVEISRSEELRLELEALRAVSDAVKSLPKEKLPVGFMARLEARRSLESSKPASSYFILPPAYRPLAFALSTAVVALVVWDRTKTPSDIMAPRVGWDSEKVAVKSAAEAPPSIDVSGQLSAMGARDKDAKGESADNAAASNELTAQSAKKEDAAASKLAASSTFGKHISAPGKPLELQEADSNASVSGAGGGAGFAALSAPAASAPTQDRLEPSDGSGAFLARNEEERSAINERLYKGFEEEKKRMGIARIMEKDAESQDLPTGGRELMALQATPDATRVDSGVAAMRGGAKAKRQSAPLVKALTLKSAEALQAAWAAASLPGEPPAVNFPDEMAVFLAGPQGCGIVTIQNRKKFIVVLYKDAGFDDASARVRAVALSPKPVVIKPAE